MQEYKKVTYKSLKIGDEIQGANGCGRYNSFRGYVKSINPSYVTIEMWRPGGDEKQFSTECFFLLPMDEEEFRQKYNEKAAECVENIQKVLYHDAIGPHSQWNSWLSSDPWELAQACVSKKLNIIGHCKDIVPKHSWAGNILDVGVCVEDDDNDRFWCHFSNKSIEVLVRRYRRYQEYLASDREEMHV